jgi:hypothetical protein
MVILRIGTKRELNMMLSEQSFQVDADTLMAMYEYATREKFSAFIIDADSGDKNEKFRKGFTEYLSPADYGDNNA